MPLGIKKKSESLFSSGRKSQSNNRTSPVKTKKHTYSPSKNSQVKLRRKVKRGTTDHYLSSDKYFNPEDEEEAKQTPKQKVFCRV